MEKVTLSFQDNDTEKSLELELESEAIDESNIVEHIVRHERPDLLSPYHLIKDQPRGGRRKSQNLMRPVDMLKSHGIENVKVEIDGRSIPLQFLDELTS